jgi:hypothetical protein
MTAPFIPLVALSGALGDPGATVFRSVSSPLSSKFDKIGEFVAEDGEGAMIRGSGDVGGV